ncbi:MAG: NfeD family protein [bacterium]
MSGIMKTALCFFFALTAVFHAQGSPLPEKEKVVYVIPVRDDIEASMVYLVRRGVKEALQNKADVLVIHMDTNGGRVDYTEDIIRALNRFKNPIYTYVDTKAISAGAFIASATQHIYMAPSSVIGALTPIMLGPQGGAPATLPKSAEEKINSAVRALVRTSAEKNGHNPKVFDAMVDADQGLKIGDVEILPKGKVLTLTNNEAAIAYGSPPKPLLSEGTMESLQAFTAKIAGASAKVVTVEPTGLERLARLITMVAPFLLSAAMIMGYIEFKTPGFGIFGILAIVCAVIFFFGHYVAGLSGYENVLLFFLGAVLIALELLFFPGIVVMGVSGFVLVVFSLLRAMADIYPTDPVLPTLPQLQLPLANLGVALLASLVVILILARLLPKTPLYHQLVLEGVNLTPLSTVEASALKAGQEGRAVTYLRPSGTADFGDGPVDVMTEGDFIAANEPIRVLMIEGSKVIVEKCS